MLMQDRIDLERAMCAAGLLVDHIEDGLLKRCKVQGDKGSKMSGWYRLFDDGDLVTCVFGNWREASRAVWISGSGPQTDAQRNAARQRIEQARHEREAAQREEWAANRTWIQALWQGARPVTAADPVGQYLASRGLDIPAGDALRHHPALSYWGGGACVGTYPAMLAAVTSPAGELVNVHRTYLSPDGRKADVPTVRKLCKSAGLMAGASIKIGQPAARPDGRLGLGVAEGIETAIAASMLGAIAVWPCVSANGLASFEPPQDVHHLYIFADNDESETGQRAAEHLGVRMAGRGMSARIHLPPTIGDWNDELLAREVTL